MNTASTNASDGGRVKKIGQPPRGTICGIFCEKSRSGVFWAEPVNGIVSMTAKKPAALRRLEGNRGHRPIPEDGPRGLGVPEPPAYLTSAERERWDEIVLSLPVGLLTRADTSTLERMAVSWAAFRDATERLRAADVLAQGRERTVVKNPLFTVQRQASEEMQRCSSSLGLSPAARTKLSAPPVGEPDPLEILMNGVPPRPRLA